MPLRVCWRAAITAQQFCSIEVASNLLVSDGISKTVVWKNQDAPMIGTSQMQERSSFRHAGADRGLRDLSNQHSKQETKDAHRAGRPADGGCSPQTVRRHRAGGALADRRTGGPWARCYAVRQRRFSDVGTT